MESEKKAKNVKVHKKSKVLFFPSDYAHKKLLKKLATAKKYCWVCIYCLTNDKISAILWDLFKNGVDVRVITDDETAGNRGSDLVPLAKAGIPIRVDNNKQARMHNKFVVIDDVMLINGSFNFTTSAYKANNENLVISYEHGLVSAFKYEFEKLWHQYEDGELEIGDANIPWRYRKHLKK